TVLCSAPPWRPPFHVLSKTPDIMRQPALRSRSKSGVFAMTDDIVIVSAVRTPVGAFNGALSSLPAHELGKVAIQAALERARVEGGDVSEVIMGQILAA